MGKDGESAAQKVQAMQRGKQARRDIEAKKAAKAEKQAAAEKKEMEELGEGFNRWKLIVRVNLMRGVWEGCGKGKQF
jgi:hypothetical protein